MKTYVEIAEILKKFEIGGITDQMLAELEASAAQKPPEVMFNKTAVLLSMLGCGDHDYKNWSWTPSANGVYSFDVEVFNVGKMYTDFLTGVSALDKEELDFKNIKEDTGNVDWEAGAGTRTVTFEWNGQTFSLEATDENDWFDLNVARELNKIIIENGNGRRLSGVYHFLP
ncbi:MAG: hypothetical protein NC314_03185 [Roseburia sp.]|nr:hypothetical protein [Roseburia sp.]MCM1241817.1 hypothetical protein [Roseburia sp.]